MKTVRETSNREPKRCKAASIKKVQRSNGAIDKLINLQHRARVWFEFDNHTYLRRSIGAAPPSTSTSSGCGYISARAGDDLTIAPLGN